MTKTTNQHQHSMDVIGTSKDIYESLFQTQAGAITGLKALIIDDSTSRNLSQIVTQHENLTHEVLSNIHIKSLAKSPPTPHLTAICLLEPSLENFYALQKELRRKNPKFESFHLVFTREVAERDLRELAKHDTSELVQSVRICFWDFKAVTPSFFSLDVHKKAALAADNIPNIANRLFTALVSMGVEPFAIRHNARCPETARLADKVSTMVREKAGLFAHDRSGKRRHSGTITSSESPSAAARSSGSREVPPLEVIVIDRREMLIDALVYHWGLFPLAVSVLGAENGKVSTGSEDLPFCWGTCGQVFAELGYLDFGSALSAISRMAEAAQDGHTRAEAARGSVEKMTAIISELGSMLTSQQETANLASVAAALVQQVDSKSLYSYGIAEQLVANLTGDKSDRKTGGGKGNRLSERALVDFLKRRLFEEDMDTTPDLACRLMSIARIRFPESAGLKRVWRKYLDTAKVGGPSTSKDESSALIHALTARIDKLVAWSRNTIDWSVIEEAAASTGRLALSASAPNPPGIISDPPVSERTAFFCQTPRIVTLAEAAVFGKLSPISFPAAAGADRSLSSSVYGSSKPHSVMIFVLGGASVGEAAALSVQERFGRGGKEGAALSNATGTYCVLGSNVVLRNGDDLMSSIEMGSAQ
eukprot:gnl/Dysnectes_brevis/679_a748_1996.p1 GENE.gnl/Dysnectes_brevis/679_a748_1996~~gnl/Dysnectes_brevis/679_a748_1996.p1  ORF type:complete len:649 (-),score=176.21 gnl/Dysnectes_brevis/679_a748_1996:1228-3174(-)